ncbi:MAG: hypothetical protein ACM3NH_01800 [Candidatus Saccharibacteria bacterium]
MASIATAFVDFLSGIVYGLVEMAEAAVRFLALMIGASLIFIFGIGTVMCLVSFDFRLLLLCAALTALGLFLARWSVPQS